MDSEEMDSKRKEGSSSSSPDGVDISLIRWMLSLTPSERLSRALQEMDAWFREHPESKLRPCAEDLQGPGRSSLMTCHGPLDLLGPVAGDRGYGDLIESSERIELEEGVDVRLLNLETRISMKEETGREKDRAVLPILRATLRERH